ncbi:hypothetical protein GA0115253_1013247 [Streptomyces sp. Termitarium-T10T-6]|nr:hypothetical protein GA0115253_1013247 [Streptomyces sp. Termitarium-T10T-6]
MTGVSENDDATARAFIAYYLQQAGVVSWL